MTSYDVLLPIFGRPYTLAAAYSLAHLQAYLTARAAAAPALLVAGPASSISRLGVRPKS